MIYSAFTSVRIVPVRALTMLMLGAALSLPGANAHAQRAPRPNMLVNTAWLAEHASDRDLVLLHVGRRVQYDSAHIAGARHVTLSDIAAPNAPGALTLQMPDAARLKEWAEAQGIGDRTRVIVVPHDDTLQSATRVFLTLAYMGALDRTSLLDGGFKTWRAEGRATTTDAPATPAPTTFTVRLKPELIATIDQVEAITLDRKSAIVDARLPRFYEGDGGGYPRPGRIPTAVNIPLNTVSTADGKMRTPTELKRLFLDAGVTDGKPVVTYCHIGQQATLLWFAAALAGYDARMFDGSFQEWSRTERMPIVGPVKK